MRVAFIAPRFSPSSSDGLDQHVLALTQALVRLGVGVEVLAARSLPGLAPLAQRRETLDGVGITWLNGGAETVERDWSLAIDAFLDRESPDLIHLESLPGPGRLILDTIQKRGLPVVHNAWDLERVATNAKALSADLLPFDANDRDAQARDSMAQDLLNQHPELGHHQGHVMPAQVDDAFWEKLQSLLSEGQAPGLNEVRKRIDRHVDSSIQIYAAFTGRYAASRWLSRMLGLITQSRVEHVVPGVDLGRFQGLSAPHAGNGVIRFGYMGTMDKASGVHLLLDAFCGMAGRAELSLFGTSDDRLHVRTLRANAERIEARWYGPIDGEDRVHAMERIDVLVVPSLWQQSAPHEIREAFAARRPVIVCDLEAPSETVIDGKNGLHFAAGEVASLRAAMQRFVDQPTLLDELELGIQPQRDISEEARQWADIYAIQRQVHEGAGKKVEGSMASFAERYEALNRLPIRQLFQKVARGLTNLSGRMGVDLDSLSAVTQAVAQGGRSRDERLGAERIRHWLETSVTELEDTRQMLMEQDSEQRMERSMMAQQVKAVEGKFVQATQDLRAAQGDRDRIQSERDALQAELIRVRSELRKRTVQLASVEEQQDWLRGQVTRLAERVIAPTPSSESEAILQPVGQIRIVVERVHAALHRNETEMTWRRLEMKRAQQAPTGILARLRGLDARTVMRNWDRVPEPKVIVEAAAPAFLSDKDIPAIQPSELAKSTPLEPHPAPTPSSSVEAKP